MRHTRRQFPEFRQLLAHDNLVLGPFEVLKDLFQLFVLVAQFLRHALDQVQSLRLEGGFAEHLQRRGHVRHLVPSAHIHPGLEIARGHAAHAAR